MEQFDAKNYRAEIVKGLKAEPDVEKRAALLAKYKKQKKFKTADQIHSTERATAQKTNFRKDFYVETGYFKHEYNQELRTYLKKITEPDSKKEYNEKALEKIRALFEKVLPGSVLVDLGCGSLNSVPLSYKFATAYDVQKYIGVEKHPDYESEGYEKIIEYAKEITDFKKITALGHKVPRHEFALETDMLHFLGKRTEQSNFMINGIDSSVLAYADSGLSDRKIAYLDKLQQEIARLTPKGGIVFGHNTVFLGRLAELGFVYRKDLVENSRGRDQFWEKL